jgi:hypothetical protein
MMIDSMSCSSDCTTKRRVNRTRCGTRRPRSALLIYAKASIQTRHSRNSCRTISNHHVGRTGQRFFGPRLADRAGAETSEGADRLPRRSGEDVEQARQTFVEAAKESGIYLTEGEALDVKEQSNLDRRSMDMRNLPFPYVTVLTDRPGKIRNICSVEEAAEWLVMYWPIEKGEKLMEAR